MRLPDQRVQYSLRMQKLHYGGEGEARQVMMRRATELARMEGMAGFQVQSYSESIESRIFLPRRMAEGEIMLLSSTPEKSSAPDETARPPLGMSASRAH